MTEIPANASARDPTAGPTRVLLVEDDPDMVPLVVHLLREIEPGCAVQWCMDSETARSALFQRPFHAVIADYLIEGQATGWSLREPLHTLHPDAGYGLLSALPLEALDRLGVPFLHKPFTQAALRAFLRTLLPHCPPQRASSSGATPRGARARLGPGAPPWGPGRDPPPRGRARGR